MWPVGVVQIETASMKSEVLRSFYTNVIEVIIHPRDMVLLLFQEGVVAAFLHL